MILRPCIRFENNTPMKQCLHILGEVGELIVEVAKGDMIKAGEEAMDVIVSVMTLFHILGFDDLMIDQFADRVDRKNQARNYHVPVVRVD